MIKLAIALILFTYFSSFTSKAQNIVSDEEDKKELSSSQPFDNASVVLEGPSVFHIGLYVAIQKKYFEKNKIKVEIIDSSTNSGINLIAKGLADFAFYKQDIVIENIYKNEPIFAVAQVLQENPVVLAYRSEAGFKQVKDLDGKVWGTWGSPIEEAIMKRILSYNQLELGYMKRQPLVKPYVIDSFRRGADFAFLYAGVDAILANQLGLNLKFLNFSLPENINFPNLLVITSTQNPIKNPTKVRKFLKSLAEGYHVAKNRPSDAAAILSQYMENIDRTLLFNIVRFYSKLFSKGSNYWGAINSSQWKNLNDFMLANGIVKAENYDPGLQSFSNLFLDTDINEEDLWY